MDFAYTTEQENLRQEVQAFIKENVTEEIRTEIEQFGSRQNRGSLTSDLYKKISDKGWIGIAGLKNMEVKGAAELINI